MLEFFMLEHTNIDIQKTYLKTEWIVIFGGLPL